MSAAEALVKFGVDTLGASSAKDLLSAAEAVGKGAGPDLVGLVFDLAPLALSFMAKGKPVKHV